MAEHTRACMAAHCGPWMADARWMADAMMLLRSQSFTPAAQLDHQAGPDALAPFVAVDGIAVIDLDGPLMRGVSKYGGTSTIDVRHALRAAAADPEVDGILLRINSPGGHVHGTPELADEIRAADAVKPVHAAVGTGGAHSAAYWAAAQARVITAHATSRVGSIGTYAVIVDSSRAAENAGMTVHVVSSGDLKGQGVEGTVISDEYLETVREEVEFLTDAFVAAVRQGRGSRLSPETLAAALDGRTLPAAQAAQIGLIDAVGTEQEAMAGLAAVIQAGRRERGRNRARVARAGRGRYTVEDMAKALAVPVHRIRYQIRRAELVSDQCNQAGAKLYTTEQMAAVQQGLRAAAARSGSLNG